MAFINHDLLFEILKRLPVKSLGRFKATSKTWLDTIESPLFVKMHLQYHHEKTKVDTHEMKILLRTEESVRREYRIKFHLVEHECRLVDGIAKFTTLQTPPRFSSRDYWYDGSCDGMILLQYYNGRNDYGIVLWNPTTRKFRRIFGPPIQLRMFFGLIDIVNICGFGFDSILQDYKIVRIDNVLHEYTHNFDVRVFTFKTNYWRIVPIGLPHKYKFFSQHTVLINGAVHFIAKKKTPEGKRKVILAFNLSTEKIVEIQLPSGWCFWSELSLKALGGRLYAQSWWFPQNRLERYPQNKSEIRLELWSMMDYGINNSWTKIMSASTPIPTSPLDRRCGGWRDTSHMVSMMPNGDILVGVGDILGAEGDVLRARNGAIQLLLYDMKKQEFTETRILNMETVLETSQSVELNPLASGGAFFWETVSFVESLLSPDNLITDKFCQI